MTVEEIKSLAPKADVFELAPDNRYIICIREVWPPEKLISLKRALERFGLHNVLVLHAMHEHVQIFDTKAEAKDA